MTSSSLYSDKRQTFFRDHFERALDYETYLQTGKPHEQTRWRSFEERLALSDSQKSTLHSFERKMPVLVMSGSWCGDCMRQGPMLRAIEKQAKVFEFRYLDSHANPELQDELRINGAEKVPVIVAFSEDFFEVARFGDRHLSVYRRKVRSELGAACDPGIVPPAADELGEELGEWVAFFERAQLLLRLAPLLRSRYND